MNTILSTEEEAHENSVGTMYQGCGSGWASPWSGSDIRDNTGFDFRVETGFDCRAETGSRIETRKTTRILILPIFYQTIISHFFLSAYIWIKLIYWYYYSSIDAARKLKFQRSFIRKCLDRIRIRANFINRIRANFKNRIRANFKNRIRILVDWNMLHRLIPAFLRVNDFFFK